MTATATNLTPVDRVLAVLEGARQAGPGQWEALCPAHPDRSPSLAVAEGEEGRAVLFCHAGCDRAAVLDALGLADRDLFPAERPKERPQRRREVARYTYTDETGTPLYDVVRTDPKGFHQVPASGQRGSGAMKGVRRVLYRLPEVRAAVAEDQVVWVVEGEKDADAMAGAGEVATCNAGGAEKWHTVPDATEQLTGAEVIVWIDNDEAGEKHGRQVIASIAGHVDTWTVVRSTEAKDAAEHIGADRNLDDLEVLARSDGDRTWLDGTTDDERPTPEATDDPGPTEPPPGGDELQPPPSLIIEDIAAVAARVDAAPPPRFLARPVWVEDAYGVIGAEDKAGKSWAALDLAVAVASGGKWLDTYPCEAPGPVLMFLGEGSDRKTIRRLRAVAQFHAATLEDLDIRVCHRAPNLTRAEHLEAIAYELDHHSPRLVILDPLYLSLGSTKSGILSEMGNVLGEIQHACQSVDAALAIVHHWNQTGSGNDRKRFTGAGPAEWGRVLASISVDNKTSSDGIDSVVDQTWRFIGDEIPDTAVKVTRRVWVDDLDDITSPMHYAVMPTPEGSHVIVAEDHDRDAELEEAITDLLSESGELSGNKLIKGLRDAGVKARDVDVRRVAQNLADGGPIRLRLVGRNTQMFSMKKGA